MVEFTDHMTFLLTNDPVIQKTITSRLYPNNPYPSFFYNKRTF